MFAYCQNCPVTHSDSEGTSPFGLLTLGDYATIHFLVQLYCCNEYNWSMEVYVSGPKGNGFLDLLDTSDPNNPHYYEVKSRGAYESGRFISQIMKYAVALIKATKGNDKIDGVDKVYGYNVTKGDCSVNGNLTYGFYDVSFKLVEKGIIVYDVVINPDRVAEAVAFGIVSFTVAAALIAAAGALAPVPA